MRNSKLLTFTVALLVAACGDKEDGAGPMEKVGKKIDQAADSARQGLDNAYLHTRARIALLDTIGTDAVRIEIDAENGHVTLSGAVRERASKELAREIVENVDGVESVRDDIRHEPGGSDDPGAMDEVGAELGDVALKAKVRLALLDAIDMSALGVDIDVADGKVVLSGTVSNEDDVAAAAKAVEGVTGVSKVRNDLEADDS